MQAQVCSSSARNQLTETHLLKIQKRIEMDIELQSLIKIIRKSWLNTRDKLSDILKPYWDYRGCLSVDFGMA